MARLVSPLNFRSAALLRGDESMFDKAVELIRLERSRQDAKWGEQRHMPLYWLAILMEEVGELAKVILENDALGMRHELVHVAAVAVAWLECLVG